MITQKPIAIIDIGSNSVRMIIYDGFHRAPAVLFNERVLAELGKTLGVTGCLNPEGIKLAFDNLERFKAVIDNMKADYFVIATAALREAKDGPAFAQKLHNELGIKPNIISGVEEARLGAIGLYSGIRDFEGVAGDLGGGSLELIHAKGQDFSHACSLPLGALRLKNSFHDKKSIKQEIRSHLDQQPWLQDAARGKTFYPIGGTWRAIASYCMHKQRYPLSIIHGYQISPKQLKQYLKTLMKISSSETGKLNMIASRRHKIIPTAARLMYEIIKRVNPDNIAFSNFGVREGLLFDKLDSKQQAQDPLLQRCKILQAQSSRFENGEAVYQWSKSLVFSESQRHKTIFLAACMLNELAWMEHRDYRAKLSFLSIITQRFGGGLSHKERIILAVAIYISYGEKIDDKILRPYLSLLTTKEVLLAQRFGLAVRLARRIGGGPIHVFKDTSLDYDNNQLTLKLSQNLRPFMGLHIEKLVDSLGENLGCNAHIVIEPMHKNLVISP